MANPAIGDDVLTHHWYPLEDCVLDTREVNDYISQEYRFSLDGTDQAKSRSYYDETGLLQWAAIDAPRFDYHPTTLMKRGWLRERFTRNFAKFSEDITDGDWTVTGASREGGTAIAPDGEATAFELRETSGGTEHYLDESLVGSEADEPVSVSAFVKRVSGSRHVAFRVSHTTTTTDYFEAVIDLDTCTATQTDVGGTGTYSHVFVEMLQNGWYRVGVTGQPSTAAGLCAMRVYLINGTDYSYSGDGASGLLVWGLQIENLGCVTHYVYNDGTSSIRRYEQLELNGKSGDDFTWWDSFQGIYYVEVEVPDNFPADAQKTILLHDSNALGVDYMIIAQQGDSPNTAIVANSNRDGNEQLFDTEASLQDGGVFRIGWAFDGSYQGNAGRQYSYVNGVGVFPATGWNSVSNLDGDDDRVTLGTRLADSLDPDQMWFRDFRFYQSTSEEIIIEVTTPRKPGVTDIYPEQSGIHLRASTGGGVGGEACSPCSSNRELGSLTNSLIGGGSNALGEITLDTSMSIGSRVLDRRAGTDTVVAFMPLTAEAATELYSGNMWISARANGSFTLTHSEATSTRSFGYGLFGTGRMH